jgi:hypothetical protein
MLLVGPHGLYQQGLGGKIPGAEFSRMASSRQFFTQTIINSLTSSLLKLPQFSSGHEFMWGSTRRTYVLLMILDETEKFLSKRRLVKLLGVRRGFLAIYST